MPSLNKVTIRSMRQVKSKINFLHNKVLGPSPSVYVGDPATWVKIVDYYGRRNTAETAVLDLESAVTANKDLMVPALGVLETWEASYYKTFLSANDLLLFPNSDRTLIGLNLTNDITPSRDTYQEIVELGQLIITGDGLRIAAGSGAMALPSIAQFTAKYTPAHTYFNTNSNLELALSIARQALKDLLQEGINLCNKSDKEIETHFDNGDRPTMRHDSGYWGVHYVSSTPISFLELTFLHSVTHAALEHVLLMANPGLEEGESDSEGFDSMNIHTFGTVTVDYTLTGFHPGSSIFETVEGETIVRTIFVVPI